MNNSVRLVENKRTFVRFHVHRRGSGGTVDAVLAVSNGTDIITLSPLNPGGVVDAKWNARRDVLNNAFLFELPDGFKQGEIFLFCSGQSRRYAGIRLDEQQLISHGNI